MLLNFIVTYIHIVILSMIIFSLLACAPKNTLQRESFEYVWNTVNQTFPYKDFQNVDWQETYSEFKPKAYKAQSTQELRPILNEMLLRLNVSHYGIIPKETYEQKKSGKTSSKKKEENSEAATTELGWNGIDSRWIAEQLVITHVGVPAKDFGIHPGWVITEIDNVSTTKMKKLFSESKDDLAFDMGLLAQHKTYGLIDKNTDFVFLDHDNQSHRISLPYQKGEGMIAEFGYLPPCLVRFNHTIQADTIHIIAFNTFMMPIRPQIQKAFQKIAQQQTTGVVIDLRGNLGGMIGLGSGLAGHLISETEKNLGVQISRSGKIFFQINPQSKRMRYDGPVAILVDELSVSTSEILAGGLKELKRARIFGQKTPGKALPSIVAQLPNGDGFQYAIADLKTPKGNRYEGDGVQPHVIIQPSRKDYIQGKDPTLDAAIQWISKNTLIQKKENP